MSSLSSTDAESELGSKRIFRNETFRHRHRKRGTIRSVGMLSGN